MTDAVDKLFDFDPPVDPATVDDKAFFDAIVAAGPVGLKVNAGRLVARADGHFDLILKDPFGDPKDKAVWTDPFGDV
jgi:hypothetical protein